MESIAAVTLGIDNGICCFLFPEWIIRFNDSIASTSRHFEPVHYCWMLSFPSLIHFCLYTICSNRIEVPFNKRVFRTALGF